MPPALRLLLAAALLGAAVLSARAQEDYLAETEVDTGAEDEGLEGDSARGQGESEAYENKAGQAPPARTPEQQELDAKFNKAITEWLLENLEPACAEELNVVLHTPPAEQTADQLTAECDAQVKSKAQVFRKQ
jgi:hypothetical protein